MSDRPHWLAQYRRICAAIASGEALAPEDAAAFLSALKPPPAAADDGARSIDVGLGWPATWRTMVRLADRADVLALCVGAGYRGRDGAKRLHQIGRRYQSASYKRDLRSGHVPNGESAMAFRLLQASGGRLPTESTLAKLLK